MAGDSKIRLTPWKSKQEWQHTYQLIFSEDFDDKQEGLENLLIWNSRSSKLPLGVESTLFILAAIVMEQPERSTPDRDIMLQSLYSHGILRFVNLVSHSGQVNLRHQPISVIAELVGIPDWLVSVRHEAAHGTMPSLGVLRPGALVAMDWLEENYWQIEDEQSVDVFWPEETNKQNTVGKKADPALENGHSYMPLLNDVAIPEHILTAVKMLLLLLQEMPSRQTLFQIKSETVKQYAYNIWLQNKVDTLSEDRSAKLYQPLAIINRQLTADLEKTISEWVDLLTQENPSLITKQSANTLKGQCLAYALNSCWELLAELKPQPYQHRLLWKLLHRWNAVPILIELLSLRDCENETQLNNCLCLVSTFSESLQDGTNFDFLPTVRNLLLKPQAETLTILNKLKKFQNPVQDLSAWGEMEELLKIRLRVGASPNKAQKINHIFTLNMVKEACETATKQCESPRINTFQLSYEGDVDAWTLCTDLDWSRMPIGSVANSCDGSYPLKLNSPDWELLDGTNEENSYTKSLEKGSKPFDWNSLARKRRRRGGLKDSRIGFSVY